MIGYVEKAVLQIHHIAAKVDRQDLPCTATGHLLTICKPVHESVAGFYLVTFTNHVSTAIECGAT